MKKLLSALLIVVSLFALVACKEETTAPFAEIKEGVDGSLVVVFAEPQKAADYYVYDGSTTQGTLTAIDAIEGLASSFGIVKPDLGEAKCDAVYGISAGKTQYTVSVVKKSDLSVVASKTYKPVISSLEDLSLNAFYNEETKKWELTLTAADDDAKYTLLMSDDNEKAIVPGKMCKAGRIPVTLEISKAGCIPVIVDVEDIIEHEVYIYTSTFCNSEDGYGFNTYSPKVAVTQTEVDVDREGFLSMYSFSTKEGNVVAGHGAYTNGDTGDTIIIPYSPVYSVALSYKFEDCKNFATFVDSEAKCKVKNSSGGWEDDSVGQADTLESAHASGYNYAMDLKDLCKFGRQSEDYTSDYNGDAVAIKIEFKLGSGANVPVVKTYVLNIIGAIPDPVADPE